MARFINDSNHEVDSEFSIETSQNFNGLVIESWGPSIRNPEYAIAFELLLDRLAKLGIQSIRVFVVSKRLVTSFPNILRREIRIDGMPIVFGKRTARELRLAIGKQVSALKEPLSSGVGGNRYKRILIHSPLIDDELWRKIAMNLKPNHELIVTNISPTSNQELFDQQVDALELITGTIPTGCQRPNKKPSQSNQIQRDPLVKAWVLRKVGGICELCDSDAPFVKDNGKPYMEVHHLRMLADGGSDTIHNTAGVCPSCHRALHFGRNRVTLMSTLYKKVSRLVPE